MFRDRRDAGKQLAERLDGLRGTNPLVLALPRGGVPVGFEIARALGASLDLALVRKIGAPGHEELAVGAVAEGPPPELFLDAHLIELLRISQAYLDQARQAALDEMARQRRVYSGGRPPLEIAGRIVILVDDGIATGATTIAALRATRRRNPQRLMLAIPVAPPQTLKQLQREADEIICLEAPADFQAVGQFYLEFPQLTDGEVTHLLDQAGATSFGSKKHPT